MLERKTPANKELDPNVLPTTIDPSQLDGSLSKEKDNTDTNCWTSPSGLGFMIRGKNYLKDNSKVMGGDPLLKLLAVDWFTVDRSVNQIALHPKCLVQSEAGKKLPFILVINLQIDVDIGSSSVARSVIGLVLGYVTSLVVDLAILIEAKEEEELPEYILGTVRLNRVRLDSAVHLDV
ncbi:hypothetical protein L484_012331 [Morus notabilis]|uniref:Protein ENHANCED DISEASE RESISTANCE 2 C-terminal domain-containing protein n=1 Tax=Morus notabilis TaxID=981085 RepID=W9S603_9ROSA|nr:hypothetical protein L484_012331 [Morus notabilis]